MSRRTQPTLATAGVVAAIILAACSTDRPTDGAEGELAVPPLPAELVLMPISDERAQRFEDVEVSRYVRDAAVRVLARKGYAAVPRDEIAGRGLAAPQNLEEMTASDLAALAPKGADGLLFLSLTRVDRGYTYGGDDYAVSVSGVVVDADTRTIVWRGSGSGRTSLGGFFHVFSPRSPAYDAVYSALKNLFRTVPKRRA